MCFRSDTKYGPQVTDSSLSCKDCNGNKPLYLVIEQSARLGIAMHNKTYTRCHAFGIFPTKRKDLLLVVRAVPGEDTLYIEL